MRYGNCLERQGDMDPFTHALIGAAAAKAAGVDISLSEPAAIAAISGAVFPDIDILLQKWGNFVYLKNHRGITHSLAGIVISGIMITVALAGFYPGTDLRRLILFALMGCLTHIVIDVFNTYGTKLLWPVYGKKISLRLLSAFDPVIIVLSAGYIVVPGKLHGAFLGMLPVYLLLRILSKRTARKRLMQRFGKDVKKVSIFPATSGLFRWHFIVEFDTHHLVGDIKMVKGAIRVKQKLKKTRQEVPYEAASSATGRFFREFTPMIHVSCQEKNDTTIYTFIDMRYYIKNRFLYRAQLEMDHSRAIVRETFNPYAVKKRKLNSWSEGI